MIVAIFTSCILVLAPWFFFGTEARSVYNPSPPLQEWSPDKTDLFWYADWLRRRATSSTDHCVSALSSSVFSSSGHLKVSVISAQRWAEPLQILMTCRISTFEWDLHPISKYLNFPVFTIEEHIRSVSHRSKKNRNGSHLTDGVNEASACFQSSAARCILLTAVQLFHPI